MNSLPEPAGVTSLPVITRQPRTTWHWAAAATVLATAAVLAFVLTPKRVSVAPGPEGAPLSPVSSFADATPPRPASAGSPSQSAVPRHSKRKPARAPVAADYYLALDDEPIETGVVMRVALGPAEIPADVIFDQDGRARAVRLIK